MQHYTTIEQSKKLVELGLNPDTADMFWSTNFEVAICSPYLTKTDCETLVPMCEAIPCWSLGALLEIMPKIRDFYYPSLYKAPYNVTACMYSTQEHDIYKIYTGEDFLEATYNMVVWLLENGYLNKE